MTALPASKSIPTSSEVARRAGVSRTTVSFVLNNVVDQGISDATRERVLTAARELGYEPNAAARTLARGSRATVGLFIPKASHLYVDAFLGQLLASINEECHRHGLKLLIESTEDHDLQPGGFGRLVSERRIGGLIFVNQRTADHECLQRLRDSKTPMVVLGSRVADLEASEGPAASTGNSARTAVNHLLGLGHRRIAHISFASAEYRAVQEREQGWRDALGAQGVDADPAWVEYADISAQSGYLAAQRLLARRVGFSALFAGNDTIAFGAIKALNEAGLRVPRDVALMGYDDIPLAAFAGPALSTMHTDAIRYGQDAMRLLLAQLQRQAGAQPVQLEREAQLIVRESCGSLIRGPIPA